MERWVSLQNLESFNRGCQATLMPYLIRLFAQIQNHRLLLHYQASWSGHNLVRKVALAKAGASATVLAMEKGWVVVAQNALVNPRYSWSMIVTSILCLFRCSFLTYSTSRPTWPSMVYKPCKCSNQLSSHRVNVKTGPSSSSLWTSKCP